MTFTSSTPTATGILSRRAWRRLERHALRNHDRALRHHLGELARRRPVVHHADASWISGTVALHLSGHRLLLGGVAPSTVWDVLALTISPAPIELTRAGRYGPYWWIAVGGDEEQVILARHLQLIHDPGRSDRSELDLPVLSGAS